MLQLADYCNEWQTFLNLFETSFVNKALLYEMWSQSWQECKMPTRCARGRSRSENGTLFRVPLNREVFQSRTFQCSDTMRSGFLWKRACSSSGYIYRIVQNTVTEPLLRKRLCSIWLSDEFHVGFCLLEGGCCCVFITSPIYPRLLRLNCYFGPRPTLTHSHMRFDPIQLLCDSESLIVACAQEKIRHALRCGWIHQRKFSCFHLFY